MIRKKASRQARIVDVVCIDMDALGQDHEHLSAALSEIELDRAARYRFERDRRRFAVRRGVLRELLAPILDLTPAEIAIAPNAWGKPGVETGSVGFNLSHAEHLALYAVAAGREVGCDIAWRDAPIEAAEIATAVLSDAEQCSLRAQPPSRRRAFFFDVWTRKEAYVKALGVGLSMSMASFDVPFEADEPTALPGGGAGWRVQSFEPAAGFHAAVVAGGAAWRLRRSPRVVRDLQGVRAAGERVRLAAPGGDPRPAMVNHTSRHQRGSERD